MSTLVRILLFVSVIGVFTPRGRAQAPSLQINEVMALNSSFVPDPQGQYDDWIELHNASGQLVDIGGMYLTDDPEIPTKWRIPADRPLYTRILPNGYLLIWADGDIADTGLHAGFRLSAGGDQLALFDIDGQTLIDSVEFDEQTADVSYGRDAGAQGQWRFFATPSPGGQNVGAYLGRVADLEFSHDRGFYDEPFTVTLTCETSGASIFYTVDGSSPFDLNRAMPIGRLYTGPIAITTTTCVRAVAFKSGWMPTGVETHTYIFLDYVVTQATHPLTGGQVTPAGCPAKWEPGSGDGGYGNWASGDHAGDYQMDPDIADGLYADTIREDMKAVPTISLVMDKDDWFGDQGIYVHRSQDGTERAGSFEFLDPAAEDGLQVNCAIAMQGGVSGGGTSLNRWKSYKLSIRPRFKTETDDGTPTGGSSKLDFKLFPDSPVERHNTVVLDAVLNHSWLHPSSGQRNTALYLQDQYVADLHNAMGGHSPHGYYAHIYISGLYWGMYWIHERPDNAWAAEVFGGDEDEYDALKHNSGGVINDGTGGSASGNYNAMLSAANAVSSDPANATKYQALCKLLDVDDFITYLLANWFAGNHDWPHKNWYATHRNTPDGKWRFHSWDAEHTLEGGNDVGESPSDLHNKLARNAEYRMRFADIIHRNSFNDGPLTYPATADLYRFRMNQAEPAIVGESARWGDNRQSRPYTQQDWLDTQNAKLTGYFPSRTGQVLGWLRDAGLYPIVDAPDFQINGRPQHGGLTAAGNSLSITAAGGTIWYTLDGSDPRLPGMAPEPVDEVKFVAENATKRVLVPTGPISDTWRASLGFNDTAWKSGTGGVGYERSSGYEALFKIDVQSEMYNHNASCYIRIPFSVTTQALQDLASLTLRVRYDDGFVAYLNGIEVQRAGFNGTPAWNSSAAGSHSDSLAVNLEPFNIGDHIDTLHTGTNLLAIHGMNQSTTSTDFLISAELVGAEAPAGGAQSGVSPSAMRYTGPVPLNQSVCVKARALAGANWSAVNEAVYAVGPVAESLRVSEIMYHPANTGNPDDPNTEFIELTNAGSAAVNLNLVRFTNGVDYTFGNFELPAGGYCLIVRDIAAFEAKYGADLPVVGQYAGSLNNGGERVEFADAVGTVIQSFRFEDNWYDLTDGLGFSLTVKDPPLTDVNSLDNKSPWRPSAEVGGSPGTDDRGDLPEIGSVVVNELLANSEGSDPDWVELHNTTGRSIPIGGWFLSDDADDLMKYEIAAGTSIPANGYLVFDEDSHFGNDLDPGCATAFALSSNGETVYLHSGAGGVVTGYSEQEKFDASDPGVTLGRYQKSTGSTNFVAMQQATPGAANAEPVVGPVVINEIMYHPPDSPDAEYVELLNIGTTPVTLYDALRRAPWRFTDDPDNPGIELLFPTDPPETLAPGEYLVLAKDLTAFDAAYTVPAGVTVLAWGAGKLANGTEKIQLSKPGDADADGNRSWIRVDRVVYSDGSHPQDFAEGIDPWPIEADGQGSSLIRTDPAAYGNDPANWQAANPLPGQ